MREFLHVDDLADACVFSLESWNPTCPEEPSFLNVGTGIDLTIKELAEIICEIIGYQGFITWDVSKPDGTPRKQLCTDAMKRLGWSPKINLRDGINRVYQDFLDESISGQVRL